MMAAGGTQLKENFEDDGIYAWKVHVDWNNPANTKADGPAKIPVAPYHYLCDGQLSNCVPQPGTDVRLDAQGDKIMQRLVYRRIGGHESVVAAHSDRHDAPAAEACAGTSSASTSSAIPIFSSRARTRPDRVLSLDCQHRHGPERRHRHRLFVWRNAQFPGQRFAARLADDPKGLLTFHETVLANGRGFANQQLSLGGLHHDGDGSRRRLHLLVRRRLPEERRQGLPDADRRVPSSELQSETVMCECNRARRIQRSDRSVAWRCSRKPPCRCGLRRSSRFRRSQLLFAACAVPAIGI